MSCSCRQTDTWSVTDVRATVISPPGYIYPLHFVLMSESSGLPGLCGPLVDYWAVFWALSLIFTKATGSHGGAWRPQGANQELQPLLLQQLQSGKKAARRESGHVGSWVSAQAPHSVN